MLAERVTRPELTLPDAEAALVAAEYSRADVILEYGSGGSTVMAAEMPGKTVFSVESDREWAAMMLEWFEENPPADGVSVEIVWSDIGPTRDWGQPRDLANYRKFAAYPLAIWKAETFRQPDLVMVDGRFREGCALAATFLTERPITLLIDDYGSRRSYHAVERYIGTPEMTGRMARFEIEPQPVPADRLLDVIDLMQRP